MDHKKEYSGHYARIERYAAAVDAVFTRCTKEAVKLAAATGHDPAGVFSFSDYPETKAGVDKLLKELSAGLEAVVKTGTTAEWEESNRKNDRLVKEVLGGVDKAKAARFFNTNPSALKAFLNRKAGGLNLSGRIWNLAGQYKEDLELALSVGIADGRSAAELGRDVRKYLNDPDKLFRRVRDQYGNLVLSQKAKAYHPGQGVYRSSYKNAMRLTRTEINMAYRAADHTRWQQLGFVVGQEVKRSNHPYECSVCSALAGKYPKSFVFYGWHPHCRCYMVPVLCTEAELSALLDESPAAKSAQTVKDVPDGYKNWIKENEQRILRAKSQPYWIRDNYKNGDLNGGFNWNPTGKTKFKTETEKKAVQEAWTKRREERRLVLKTAGNVLAKAKEYPEIGTAKLDKYIKGYRLNEIRKETKTVAKAVQAVMTEEKKLSTLLVDVKAIKAEFGVETAKTLYTAVENKLKQWEELDLQTQIKKLKFEIDYVESKKAYSTWKQAQQAYKKQLAAVQEKQAVQLLLAEIKAVETHLKTTKSPVLKNLMAEIASLQTSGAGSKEIAQVVGKAKTKIAQLEQAKLKKSLTGLQTSGGQLENWLAPGELSTLKTMEAKYVNLLTGGKTFADGSVRNAYEEYARCRKDLAAKYIGKQAAIPKLNGETPQSAAKALHDYINAGVNKKAMSEVGGKFQNACGTLDRDRIKKTAKLTGATEDEMGLVMRYSHGSQWINNYLYGKSDSYFGKVYDYGGLCPKYTQALNQAIEKLPRYEGTVFSGLKNVGNFSDYIKRMETCLDTGKPFENSAFLSSSTDLGTAASFDGLGMLVIKSKNGGIMDMVSHYASEEEVLFRAGTRYKVVKISRGGSGNLYSHDSSLYVIELEEL